MIFSLELWIHITILEGSEDGAVSFSNKKFASMIQFSTKKRDILPVSTCFILYNWKKKTIKIV